MAGDYADFSKDTLGRSRVYSEAYFGSEHSELSGEYTLPDYLPDMAKILYVGAKPVIREKNVDNESVGWMGEVHYNVVYITPDGSPSSAVFAEPFEGRVTIGELSDECIADFLPTAEKVSVKPINIRRVGIRSTVAVRAVVLCEKNVDTDIRGKQTAEDGFNLEYLRHAVKSLDIKTGAAREVMISEDFEIDSGFPSVKDIVSVSASVLLPEVRPRADEAEVNADVMLDFVFETEEGEYGAMHKRIRVSNTVSVPGLRPEYECTANLTPGILKASAQNNSYGERRIIELDFPCDIEVSGYLNREVSVIFDMYSTACGLETEKTEVEASVFRRIYSSNASVNTSASKENLGLGAVGSIVDGSAVLEESRFEYLPDKHRILAEGTVVLTVVVCDEDDKNACRTGIFHSPYRIEIDAGEESGELRLIGRAAVLTQRYRADASNLYGDIEVGVQIIALEKQNRKYVSTAVLNKDISPDARSGGFTLYYPEENETLWNIAKKYQVSGKALENANPGRESGVVLIPNKQTKAAAFSKII